MEKKVEGILEQPAYADDIAVMGEGMDMLEKVIKITEKWMEEKNIQIN